MFQKHWNNVAPAAFFLCKETALYFTCKGSEKYPPGRVEYTETTKFILLFLYIVSFQCFHSVMVKCKSPLLMGVFLGHYKKVASSRVSFHFISLKCESVLYTGCRKLSNMNKRSLYDGCISLHHIKAKKCFLNG